jgi:hypothetical protein
MLKRIPGFFLWVVLAVAVGVLPFACGSDDSKTDGAAMTPN